MVDALNRCRVPSDAELLVQPETCDNLGAEIALLVRQSAHRQAANARTMQEVEDRMQTAAENEEVSKMRDKAMVELVAGVTTSAVRLGADVIDLGAQVKSFSAKAKALQNKVDPSKDLDCVMADKLATTTHAAAGFAKESAKAQTEIMQFAATLIEADAKAAGNTARHHERLGQTAKDDIEAARKLADAAVEFNKEWTETTNATSLAVSRRA